MKLFLHNCREITTEEIYNLILADERFPYHKFLASLKDKVQDYDQPIEMTEELKKELLRKLSNS